MKVTHLKRGQVIGIRQINALGKSTFGCRGIVKGINPVRNTALVRYASNGEEHWVNGMRLYIPVEEAKHG